MSKPARSIGDVSAEHEKALAIFKRLRSEIGDGRKHNSMRKKDADLILGLLEAGGDARMNVFRLTFAEHYKIDGKRAGQRAREAMKDLVDSKKITKSSDKQPIFSLTVKG